MSPIDEHDGENVRCKPSRFRSESQRPRCSAGKTGETPRLCSVPAFRNVPRATSHDIAVSHIAPFATSAKGKYDEAESFYRRALEVTKDVLGEGHQELAQRLNNLAVSLESQVRETRSSTAEEAECGDSVVVFMTQIIESNDTLTGLHARLRFE